VSRAPQDDWLRNLRPQPERLTAAQYEELPEELCRSIEVVDGYIVYCEAPTPEHQRAGRRLANLLEGAARKAMTEGHECLDVDTDVDVRLRDLPLLNRRPDVVLYRSLERDQRLYGQDVVLMVEIVSPGSQTQDTADKVMEYAQAGIPHYWIVWIDTVGVSQIELYRLDRATSAYKHVGTVMREERSVPRLEVPVPVEIDWDALRF
jgi:Uma2 family endonuclease